MYHGQQQQRAADYRKTQAQQQQAALTNHIHYINSLPTDPESIKIRVQAASEVGLVFIPLYLISIATIFPILVLSLARCSNRTMLRASASSGGLMTVLSCYFWYRVFWAEKNQKTKIF
jgi:uncharacterized membrane protein